jgi:signal transduction histidine kinase
MAEELLRGQRFKEDLMELIIHDLRNPLAGLQAYLSLIESDTPASELMEVVDGARSASDRLASLVDDLLQVRLMEDGAWPWRPARCSPMAVVEQAMTTVAGIARERRLVLDLVAESAPEEMVGDAALLRRAMENLLSNAIKHSPSRGRIVVGLFQDGGDVGLFVDDDGPGLSREQSDMLFTKYGSVELKLGGRHRSHGLGLYLVALVMQYHGGRVMIANRQGATGVRALLRWPRVHASSPDTGA